MTAPKSPWPVQFPVLLLTAMLRVAAPLLVSQDLPQPVTSRFEIAPLATYRTHLTLPIETGIEGVNPKVVLDSSPGFEIGLGLRINNDNLIEIAWSRQDSYARIENSSAVLPSTHVTLNQVHCDFSQEYGLGHRMPWLRPFLVGSVGATNIDGTTSGSTHLSVGVGGVVGFLAGRHLAIQNAGRVAADILFLGKSFTVRWRVFSNIGGTLASQAEIALGPIFRF